MPQKFLYQYILELSFNNMEREVHFLFKEYTDELH